MCVRSFPNPKWPSPSNADWAGTCGTYPYGCDYAQVSTPIENYNKNDNKKTKQKNNKTTKNKQKTKQNKQTNKPKTKL